MEGTLRRVRSPPAAWWTETLDNLWRINWFLRSFSLWARHSAETSAELNVRLGAAEFFPVASRQVRRVRKRRREGNARGLCLITASCPKTPLVAQKLRSHGRGFLNPSTAHRSTRS